MSDRFTPSSGSGSMADYDQFLAQALNSSMATAPSFTSGGFGVSTGAQVRGTGHFRPNTSSVSSIASPLSPSGTSWPGYNDNWIIADPNNPMGSVGYGGSGNIAVAGGDWAALDRFNNDFASAAGKYGVPANLLKALVNNESSGDWERDGSRIVYLGDRGYRIAPFTGITEPVVNQYGYTMEQVSGNRALQLDIAAHLIADLARDNGGFENAVKIYFGGSTGEFVDENGMRTSKYAQKLINNWKYLDGLGGGSSDPFAKRQNIQNAGGFALSSINPSGSISQEFGPTDFANGNGLYNYGSDYTRNRQPMGHPGIDYALPYGSELRAPVGGTVIAAGGTGFYCNGDYGQCGPGSGELRIQLDNGDQVILGHMSQINLREGQRVNPGQVVGLSGSENGGHVHVEYRRWVGNGITNSGYEVVDPRTALPGVGGAPGYTGSAQPAYTSSWGAGYTQANTIPGLRFPSFLMAG